MKIIAIGGEPATGKTEIIRKIRENENKPKVKSFGLLQYEVVRSRKTIYLGRYKGHKFDGTDRLSMAVQGDAKKFMKIAENRYSGYTIIFEGDRLFNKSFLTFLFKYQPVIIIVATSEKIAKSRHKKREDTQKQTFLKSRKTKILNIAAKFPYIRVYNNNKEDLKNIVNLINTLIKVKKRDFISIFKTEREVGLRALSKKHKFW